VKDVTLDGASKGRIFIKSGKGGISGNTTMLDEVTDKVTHYIRD
jgi:hypothetical protein